ncbi:MAG: radical SAM protein [Deltaproteobacteria bacterium]|nr:radical SAM protein [Deltaproteobacteria bacterium]
MPETFSLVVTRSCNLECTYCPVEKGPVHLAAGQAREAVRTLARRGGGLVRLTGGEPSLRWKTVSSALDEVEAARETGASITVEICTNGAGLGGRRLERLDRPWVRVILSLDGTQAAQEASGRVRIEHLDDLMALPGFSVTQTIAPEQSGRVLDNFLHLWGRGIRRFNFLPVYYVRWPARSVKDLAEGLDAVAGFLAPRLGRGGVDVLNLHRSGAVPLFNDDITLDADGTWYRTNLVLADRVTHPVLESLRAGDASCVPDVPADLRDRLEGLLESGVRRSNRAVDGVLDRFVAILRRGGAGRTRPAVGVRRRPERLEFHISYECPNSCLFCSEAHRLEQWRDRPVSAMEVHRTIVSHARAGGTHVNLTGGEPSAHPAFDYALDLARSHGMRTFVGTNGARLADRAFASRIMPLIDELSLSIHGSGAAVHDRMTGRRGSFDDLLETRRNAARFNESVSLFVNCVVTRRNVDDVGGVLELCNRLGVPTLIISNVAPEGRALDRYERLAVPLGRWRTMAPSLARRAGELGVQVRFFGLPLCVLGDARMKSNDLHWDPRVTVERARGPRGSVRLATIAALKPRRGRRYSRRCRGCLMRDVCGGVFSEYLETHGDEEIEAIRD